MRFNSSFGIISECKAIKWSANDIHLAQPMYPGWILMPMQMNPSGIVLLSAVESTPRAALLELNWHARNFNSAFKFILTGTHSSKRHIPSWNYHFLFRDLNSSFEHGNRWNHNHKTWVLNRMSEISQGFEGLVHNLRILGILKNPKTNSTLLGKSQKWLPNRRLQMAQRFLIITAINKTAAYFVLPPSEKTKSHPSSPGSCGVETQKKAYNGKSIQ